MHEEFASMLLQITSSTIKQFTEQQRERGDDFNVFSILGTERSEVGTHSKFLYELLNSQGCHSQGSVFVDKFLTQVLSLKDSGYVISAQREDPTQENRRIDFTINTDKYLIGIEMKIDAGDQEAQLSDYYCELEKRAKHDNKKEAKLFYLTLYGSDPSKESLKNLDTDKVYCISFEKEILRWIDSCIEVVALKPVIRELLNQYRLLIRKITHQNTELSMKISEEIGKNKNSLIAAEQISKSYQQTTAMIEANVWHFIVSSLKQNPVIIESDVAKSRSSKGDKSWFGIGFKVGKENDTYIWVNFSINNDHNFLYFHIFPADEKGQKKGGFKFSDSCLTNPFSQEFSNMDAEHGWGDFVKGSLDDTFKLRGSAEDLSQWIGVTEKSSEIVKVVKKIEDTLELVKKITNKYSVETSD